jgi:hypothetical protein
MVAESETAIFTNLKDIYFFKNSLAEAVISTNDIALTYMIKKKRGTNRCTLPV